MIAIEHRLSGNRFGIKFEGKQIPIPKQIADVPNLDWQNTVFVSQDYHSSFVEENRWVELLVTEGNTLYRETYSNEMEADEKEGVIFNEQGMRITQLDTFTGEIHFWTFVPVDDGEDDYYCFFKATFHNGKLEKVEEKEIRKAPNTERTNASQEINENVKKQIKRMKNPLYRFLYVPYKVILTIIVGVTKFLLLLPIKLLDFLYKILTPF